MQKEKEIKQKLGLQGYFALQPCDCILDVSGCDGKPQGFKQAGNIENSRA